MLEVIAEPREEVSTTRRRCTASRSTRTRSAWSSAPAARWCARSRKSPAAPPSTSRKTARSSSVGINEEVARKAIQMIEGLTKEVKVGEIYTGKVTRLLNFGVVRRNPSRQGRPRPHLAAWRRPRRDASKTKCQRRRRSDRHGHRNRQPRPHQPLAPGGPARRRAPGWLASGGGDRGRPRWRRRGGGRGGPGGGGGGAWLVAAAIAAAVGGPARGGDRGGSRGRFGGGGGSAVASALAAASAAAAVSAGRWPGGGAPIGGATRGWTRRTETTDGGTPPPPPPPRRGFGGGMDVDDE